MRYSQNERYSVVGMNYIPASLDVGSLVNTYSNWGTLPRYRVVSSTVDETRYRVLLMSCILDFTPLKSFIL